MEQLQEFYNSLPEELQGKIAMLEPEEQQQVLMSLMQRYQDSQSEYAQMGANPQGNKVPVEAERNETITVQDGEEPEVEGGYLKQISRNPVSGQATYEIPDNHHNATHDQGGVSMELKEGDVVNSDKTKIPTDFKVDGSNFKGKTFKQASDFISKKENDLQKNFNDLAKKGKVDKVSEGSLSIMLAKLASSRNQLNELQEIVLGHKEKTKMRLGGSVYAETGVKVGERIPYIYDFQMPNYQYDNLSAGKASPKLPENVKDRMVNTYHAPYPVIQAEAGVNLNSALSAVNDLYSKVQQNRGASISDIASMAKSSGLMDKISTPSVAGFFDISGKSAKIANVNMPKEDILRTIVSESKKSGVDPAFMLAMGHIESRFNPSAKAGKSSATGLYQFIDSTAKQYGLLGDGFDNRKDPIANTKAAIQLTKDNQKALEKYGIPVNPTTLYLAHQQGIGGAAEIYNAAMKGTPVSVAVARNMQNNFKTTDPASYLSKTAQEVMSRVNAYIPKLDNFDQKADYEAFNYKQNYSTNAPIQQIKDNISQYGMKGLIKRTKEGAPLTAYNEQSPEQEQYQKYGGSIGKPYSMTIPGSDYMGGRRDYILDGNYAYGGYAQKGINVANFADLNKQAQSILGRTFDTPEQYQSYMLENYPELVQQTFNQGIWPTTNQGKRFNVTKPLDPEETTKTFLDKLYEYRGFIPQDKKFATTKEYEDFLKSHPTTALGKTGSQYYYDPQAKTWIMPEGPDPESKPIDNIIPTPVTATTPTITSTDELETPVATTATPVGTTNVPKKGDWTNRLQYGMGELLPYLDNLRLLREERIMPVLQQKPYQNPYDNLSTDYSIQSALNDIDRNTLTQMADERGNPSVRNARMAQVYANAIAGKAPLYTQKYNKEQELKNAKTLGQYDYLNKWTDTNMALQKRYEQEVLQTIENQRQQQHMALNKMANDYLRRREQNQALQLSTMDTNYVWNPYTQQLEVDPKKQKAQYDLLHLLNKLQGNTSTTEKEKKEQKKEEKEKEKTFREVIKNGIKTYEPIEKYGGSIKGKKKLSLKNYY